MRALVLALLVATLILGIALANSSGLEPQDPFGNDGMHLAALYFQTALIPTILLSYTYLPGISDRRRKLIIWLAAITSAFCFGYWAVGIFEAL